jgi:hypothetical protein
MTQLDEALARYDKLIHTPSYQDLAWVQAILERMAALKLAPSNRPVCPVLRPHIITRKQLDSISKTAEVVSAAMDRVKDWALSNPQFLAKLQLLPAERMLSAVEPGYPYTAVSTLLDLNVTAGSADVLDLNAEGPTGIVFTEPLAEIFYDSPPLKELRKKFKLSKHGSSKKLIQSMLAAYKILGKKRFPRIAVVEFRQALRAGPTHESMLLAEAFRASGYPAEVVTPEQLEYRNGELRRGDFGIDIVYRRVSAQELLVRFDLNHPLLRAYRERAVCVVNSFRAEMVTKLTLLAVLTDDAVLAQFPAAERKILRQHLPWTRFVAPVKSTYGQEAIDLPEYIAANREKLLLRPLEAASDQHSYDGAELEQPVWERAIKTALRNRYVVQERRAPARAAFPVYQFGNLEMRQMSVTTSPHLFLGKVDGASAVVEDATSSFSLLKGVTPVFILEGVH